MNQAFVKLDDPLNSIGDMRNNPASKLAPLRSFTNTDSAGGEACENVDEMKEFIKCDQDEPILPKENQKMLLKAANSSGDDMHIFDDPSIQDNPKRSFHKPSTQTNNHINFTKYPR